MSTEGFRNNDSRRYGLCFSLENVIWAPLSTLLEYTGIFKGRPHYHEIQGTGGGSVREREDNGGGPEVSIRINCGAKVLIRYNFSTKP